METIKNYLDNMFAALLTNEEGRRLKTEMLSNMEEHYNELKASGHSENEAVGIVISEFGNIEELAKAMNVTLPAAADADKKPPLRHLDYDTALKYISAKQDYAKALLRGVPCFICGPAAVVFLTIPAQSGNPAPILIGIALLLILVAIGVAIMYPAVMKVGEFDQMIYGGGYYIDTKTAEYAKELYNSEKPRYARTVIAGVSAIIISVLAVVAPVLLSLGAAAVTVGVAVLMIIVAFAAAFLAKAAFFLGASGDLLQNSGRDLLGYQQNAVMNKGDRITGVIASFYWPIIVAAYLIWSFGTGDWVHSWIIWPVSGLVFGAISGAIGAYFHTINK